MLTLETYTTLGMDSPSIFCPAETDSNRLPTKQRGRTELGRRQRRATANAKWHPVSSVDLGTLFSVGDFTCSRHLLQSRVDLCLIETDDHGSINQQNRSGHVAQPPQLFHCIRVFRNVLVFKWNLLLRKILLRFATEESTGLRINHNLLHLAPHNDWFLAVIRLRDAKTWLRVEPYNLPFR
jgi:hypothetical protein